MSTPFKDHFSGHAGDYRTFRPTYPPELFTFLASVVPAQGLVWDCGTGSGQAAVVLAEHFTRVFATDASAEQVKNAEPHPKVEYVVAPAEKCPLPDASADLVTVAQALHWFDLERFFAEVNRVCKPGGALAVWSYDLHSVNAEVDPVLDRLQSEFVGPYWPPERALVDAGYRTIPFPFDEIAVPPFEMSADWDLPTLIGYMNTWSATKRFQTANGFNPVERLDDALTAAWGAPATVRTVCWKFVLRVGRVSEAKP
ncbi:class I SAM-dependent methyltransferase [Gemmata sp. G18]|uniref:Class I SAM-dependent methyltransferase n=1 Tax=Gemmata palustris TaxID=2822762 RepID=A0ABS5BP92_9BACT|nr:class I SAM-dependent methyltransferase [Gemmata palustris]MBP3955508.1 class I SAM-dependent methyltransferase [Gemmata palustris]